MLRRWVGAVGLGVVVHVGGGQSCDIRGARESCITSGGKTQWLQAILRCHEPA